MTPSVLIRGTGLSCVLCGALTAIFWVLHPSAADPRAVHDAAFWAAMQTPAYAAVNGMFVLILLACLVGLVGLYARQAAVTGWLGLAGFLLAFTGTALFIGAAVFQAFVAPTLAASETERLLLEPDGPLFAGPLTPLFAGGGLAFAAGFVLFALAMLRARTLPRWASLLLLLSSPILGLSPAMPLVARLVGSAAFGLAFVALGLALWSERTPALAR